MWEEELSGREVLKARSVSCGMKGKVSADLAEVLYCWLGLSLY